MAHKGFFFAFNTSYCLFSLCSIINVHIVAKFMCRGFFLLPAAREIHQSTSLGGDAGFEGTAGNEPENCIDNVDCHCADWCQCVRLGKSCERCGLNFVGAPLAYLSGRRLTEAVKWREFAVGGGVGWGCYQKAELFNLYFILCIKVKKKKLQV